MSHPSDFIYKICPRDAYHVAKLSGEYLGSVLDQKDGFIHLSSYEQVKETAARHFRGQAELVLMAVRSETLGAALKWEPSRGGALFPHLYGPLPFSAIESVFELPLLAEGTHQFPDGF